MSRYFFISLFFLALLLTGLLPRSASAQVSVNINFIAGYYAVPAPTVVYYENRLHSWEDADTVFFLSNLTGYSPAVIVNWRMAGLPWTVIVGRLHVPPDVFYVPYRGDEDEDYFEEHEGPPYGKAWGYWAHHGGRRVLVLSDSAIRNRVVLLSTSRYYGIPVTRELADVGEHRASFDSIISGRQGEHGHWGKFDRGYFEHGKRIPYYRGGGNEGNKGWKGHGEHGASHGHDFNSWFGGGEKSHGHGEESGKGHGNGGGHGHGEDHGHGHGHGEND